MNLRTKSEGITLALVLATARPGLAGAQDFQAGSQTLLVSTTVDQVYTPVTPCRFVDGINAADRVSSPAGLTDARYYRVRGSVGSDFVSQGAASTAPTGCGIPLSATAVMVNLTVADPDQDGDLKVDPAECGVRTWRMEWW